VAQAGINQFGNFSEPFTAACVAHTIRRRRGAYDALKTINR
jgi:hypothetical protein